MTNLTQFQRTELGRDHACAAAQRETPEQRVVKRETKADNWAHWFREQMDAGGCADPVELLPDALARLEQQIDDRIAVAVNELKTAIRGALK